MDEEEKIILLKDFDNIKAELENHEIMRDKLIKMSRDVITTSKKIIYSIHRQDENALPTHVSNIKNLYNAMLDIISEDPKLYFEGSYKMACQEYVEALAYHGFINGNFPTALDLNVSSEFYLMGLCDLGGELVRNAINAGLRENYEQVRMIWNFVDQLYYELMLFDFPNSELRKKFDGLKWDLKKLDEIMLSLKLNKNI